MKPKDKNNDDIEDKNSKAKAFDREYVTDVSEARAFADPLSELLRLAVAEDGATNTIRGEKEIFVAAEERTAHLMYWSRRYPGTLTLGHRDKFTMRIFDSRVKKMRTLTPVDSENETVLVDVRAIATKDGWKIIDPTKFDLIDREMSDPKFVKLTSDNIEEYWNEELIELLRASLLDPNYVIIDKQEAEKIKRNNTSSWQAKKDVQVIHPSFHPILKHEVAVAIGDEIWIERRGNDALIIKIGTFSRLVTLSRPMDDQQIAALNRSLQNLAEERFIEAERFDGFVNELVLYVVSKDLIEFAKALGDKSTNQSLSDHEAPKIIKDKLVQKYNFLRNKREQAKDRWRPVLWLCRDKEKKDIKKILNEHSVLGREVVMAYPYENWQKTYLPMWQFFLPDIKIFLAQYFPEEHQFLKILTELGKEFFKTDYSPGTHYNNQGYVTIHYNNPDYNAGAIAPPLFEHAPPAPCLHSSKPIVSDFSKKPFPAQLLEDAVNSADPKAVIMVLNYMLLNDIPITPKDRERYKNSDIRNIELLFNYHNYRYFRQKYVLTMKISDKFAYNSDIEKMYQAIMNSSLSDLISVLDSGGRMDDFVLYITLQERPLLFPQVKLLWSIQRRILLPEAISAAMIYIRPDKIPQEIIDYYARHCPDDNLLKIQATYSYDKAAVQQQFDEVAKNTKTLESLELQDAMFNKDFEKVKSLMDLGARISPPLFKLLDDYEDGKVGKEIMLYFKSEIDNIKGIFSGEEAYCFSRNLLSARKALTSKISPVSKVRYIWEEMGRPRDEIMEIGSVSETPEEAKQILPITQPRGVAAAQVSHRIESREILSLAEQQQDATHQEPANITISNEILEVAREKLKLSKAEFNSILELWNALRYANMEKAEELYKKGIRLPKELITEYVYSRYKHISVKDPVEEYLKGTGVKFIASDVHFKNEFHKHLFQDKWINHIRKAGMAEIKAYLRQLQILHNTENVDNNKLFDNSRIIQEFWEIIYEVEEHNQQQLLQSITDEDIYRFRELIDLSQPFCNQIGIMPYQFYRILSITIEEKIQKLTDKNQLHFKMKIYREMQTLLMQHYRLCLAELIHKPSQLLCALIEGVLVPNDLDDYASAINNNFLNAFDHIEIRNAFLNLQLLLQHYKETYQQYRAFADELTRQYIITNDQICDAAKQKLPVAEVFKQGRISTPLYQEMQKEIVKQQENSEFMEQMKLFMEHYRLSRRFEAVTELVILEEWRNLAVSFGLILAIAKKDVSIVGMLLWYHASFRVPIKPEVKEYFKTQFSSAENDMYLRKIKTLIEDCERELEKPMPEPVTPVPKKEKMYQKWTPKAKERIYGNMPPKVQRKIYHGMSSKEETAKARLFKTCVEKPCNQNEPECNQDESEGLASKFS